MSDVEGYDDSPAWPPDDQIALAQTSRICPMPERTGDTACAAPVELAATTAPEPACAVYPSLDQFAAPYQVESVTVSDQPLAVEADSNAAGISLSGISQYMRELRGITRLPAGAEQEVVEQARCGDRAARQRLIEHRLPYIVHMALVYHVYAEHEDLMDIVGVANLAITANLDKALDKENPAAYLCGVAKQEIRTYCFYHSRLMPIKDHRMPRAEAPTVTSLDKIGEELVHRYLGSLAQSDTSEMNKARRDRISQALGQLTDQERQVVELHNGINGQKYTFTDIAWLLGNSASIVSRQYYRVLERLREVVAVPER